RHHLYRERSGAGAPNRSTLRRLCPCSNHLWPLRRLAEASLRPRLGRSHPLCRCPPLRRGCRSPGPSLPQDISERRRVRSRLLPFIGPRLPGIPLGLSARPLWRLPFPPAGLPHAVSPCPPLPEALHLNEPIAFRGARQHG